MQIDHIESKGKVFSIIDGMESHILYKLNGDVMDITHTFVPKELGGKGVAAKLTEFILSYAQDNAYSVIPSCSYIRVFLTRNAAKYPSLKVIDSSPFKSVDGLIGHACGIDKPDK